MRTKNFKFKSMALVLFALVLSSNVWGADWSYTFTSTESAGSKTWEDKALRLSQKRYRNKMKQINLTVTPEMNRLN